MRVLLLSQFFNPEPTLKGLAFARALQRQGLDVEVLTGYPNYPGGRLYPGYRRRLWSREVIEGVVVNRVWLYPSHDRSALRRIGNYVSFALTAAIFGPWRVRRPEAIYVHHPPPTIAWPAGVLRAVTGAKFIYEIQDIWPDTLAATGMLSNPTLLAIIGRWCKRIYRRADHLVVISPGFRDLLVERGVPSAKVDLVYNWCDEDRLVPSPRDPVMARSLGIGDGFIVMFAGTLGLAQGLDTVLDTAELCRVRVPNARFVFVGDGVERARLQASAAARNLTNIDFVARQPLERMGPVLALADALLVHLKDDPLFAITVPSKTQAYLRVGIPIVMAVRGDGADLVARSGGGITCPPEDPERLADAVLSLASRSPEERAAMGAAGRRFYERELSLDTGSARYAALFRSLRLTTRRSA
ncbi:MAG: glycosyltransferase family 4 protein [Gemmatimonadaceae bacterium]